MIEAPSARRQARKERKGPRREGESSVDCGMRSCIQRWTVSSGLDGSKWSRSDGGARLGHLSGRL